MGHSQKSLKTQSTMGILFCVALLLFQVSCSETSDDLGEEEELLIIDTADQGGVEETDTGPTDSDSISAPIDTDTDLPDDDPGSDEPPPEINL